MYARGNPFLTELLAEGPAFDDDGAPTIDVLCLVEARFARLDADDTDELRGLVERAAVAGEELSAEVLLSLLGDDAALRRSLPATTSAALASATDPIARSSAARASNVHQRRSPSAPPAFSRRVS